MVAELAISHPEPFRTWHHTSQYIIALQTDTAEALANLYQECALKDLTVQPFYEPDLDGQLTALAFVPHVDVPRALARLPLAKGSIIQTRKNS